VTAEIDGLGDTRRVTRPKTQRIDFASLFEVDRSWWLYPDLQAELEAVRDRRKGISVHSSEGFSSTHHVDLKKRARKLGLVVEERVVQAAWLPGSPTVYMGFACHEDQRWRADAIALLYEDQPFGSSDGTRYYQSVLFGFTREQARSFVELMRHQWIWVRGTTIFFTCSTRQRAVLERIQGGAFIVPNPNTIELFRPMEGNMSLRRDALERIPSSLSIGRLAIAQGTYERVFEGVERTGNFLVTRCNRQRADLIRDGATSRIEFWTGSEWSYRSAAVPQVSDAPSGPRKSRSLAAPSRRARR
jgi:hypothetical protein